jgi:eukaryotic-like serine/threonine-protein kinase
MNAREQPVVLTVGDPYRLGRRIGAGNMGSVYDAHHLRHEKRCVVKVMNRATADSSEAVARFHSQAEIASRLAHQNLVRVLDFGTASTGEPFLVMERLEGEDLARRLHRVTRLDPPLVAHICRQVAAALAAAHDRGVVHAALKPTNVFLVPRKDDLDVVKVLDCGTAQVENARALVHPGMVPGIVEDTLPYVAPEQAGAGTEARTIDHRTDQWALACVAWHMVTGHPPFAGDDATTLLYQIAYEDPLPVPDDIVVPMPVMKVLRQALEKRPDNRYADVTAFARALVEVAGTLTPPPKGALTPPPKAKSAPRKKAEAAPRPTLLGMPTLAPSEPVFLPGVSRRASPKQARGSRASSAAQTRVQGLRVRTNQDVVAEVQGDTPVEPTRVPVSSTPPPSPSAPSSSRWAGLRGRAAAMPRRRLMLLSALPVGVALVLLISWSVGGGPPPVNVDRAATPSPAPATTSRPGTTGRPVIVPIASRSRGPVAGSRRRARASRAKRAALMAKARRAESRRDRRGSRAR